MHVTYNVRAYVDAPAAAAPTPAMLRCGQLAETKAELDSERKERVECELAMKMLQDQLNVSNRYLPACCLLSLSAVGCYYYCCCLSLLLPLCLLPNNTLIPNWLTGCVRVNAHVYIL